MTDENASSTATGISANLDLLRAIAVLLVLLQHLCRRAHIDQVGWIATSSLGLFGVLLFFVHTSLVLMQSMERSYLTGWPLINNFYIRRVFRIYPLSILAVSTALVLHLTSDINGIRGLSYSAALGGKREILGNLLLVQNIAQVKSIVNILWTLPLELQMYVFLPLLFMWIQRRKSVPVLFGVWGLAVLLAFAQPHFPALAKLSILLFLPNFIPGVIAYCPGHKPRAMAALWPVFIVSLVLLFTIRPVPWVGWILCLVLGVSIPLFLEISTPWLRWISNRIATYSYGIYISHQFCIWMTFDLLGYWPLRFRIPLLIALLTTVPIALYYAIEKPMIRLGSRLANRFSSRIRLPAADSVAQ